MIQRLIIFGAAGDLTSRYLAPALCRLEEAGELLDEFSVLGVSRSKWDTDAFRKHLRDRLERHVSELSSSCRSNFLKRIEYRRGDATDPEFLSGLLQQPRRPTLFYLALPPQIQKATLEALAEIGLPEESRIVVEKPFGHDLASARELNELVHRSFPEQAVFRIDHFLGKQTIQNIISLRFANRIFEPIWNRNHIARVQIAWDEQIALEGRAGYYDSSGALRDMIQNHLLQLLCLVGMEAPTRLDQRGLRDRKVDLLRAVRCWRPEDAARNTVRGRYSAGKIDGREIPSYVDEPGVEADRNTETFAQVSLRIDNWRWAGVPFLLRSGKALARNRRTISVHFQQVPHLAFGSEFLPRPNVLRFQVDPDRISLDVDVNREDGLFCLKPIQLGADLVSQEMPAYAHLMLDILNGDSRFFIRDDEVEESWRIMEPILQAWKGDLVPLVEYPAGSEGPESESSS